MIRVTLRNIVQKISFILVVLFLVFFMMKYSVVKIWEKNYIWIEAEDASVVERPLMVDTLQGASKSRGIISLGAHQSNEGYAIYNFEVPQEGDYTIWARCYWPHFCANAFRFNIDGSKMIMLGENPVTSNWHWLNCYEVHLKKGIHEFVLWNHEAQSTIDKLFFTTDLSYIPSGHGKSNDVYLDFEDDLDPDVFLMSDKDSWYLEKDKNLNSSLLLTNNDSSPEKALIKLGNSNDYTYRLSYRKVDSVNKSFIVYLDYHNEKNHFRLEVADHSILFKKIHGGKHILIEEKHSSQNLISNAFQDLAVKVRRGVIRIKLNGKDLFDYNSGIAGDNNGSYVGIGSSSTNIYFDNIAVYSESKVGYGDNFHYTNFYALSQRPETSTNYFERLKKGMANWHILSGNWRVKEKDAFQGLVGTVASHDNEPAKIVFGDDFWDNYTMEVSFKLGDESGLGVLFDVHDRYNYSFFSWEKRNESWMYKLARLENGKELLLSRKVSHPMKVGNSFWYNLKLITKDSLIRVLIDDEIVFDVKDSLQFDGKVGFKTGTQSEAVFDDIQLYPTDNLGIEPATKYTYQLFYKNQFHASSYADWIPSSDSVIEQQYLEGRGYEPIYPVISKDLFERVSLRNKRVFSGDFSVSLKAYNTPRDVDLFFKFLAWSNGRRVEHKLKISKDQILFREDSERTFVKTAESNNRSKVNLFYQDGVWKVEMNKNTLIEHQALHKIDSTEVIIGYEGIGKGKIYLTKVQIKENL